jgi:DME family drug/metabolite transporter
MGVGGLLQALYAAGPIRGQWRLLLAQWPLVSLGALAVAVYPLAFYTSMHLAGVAVGTVVSIGSAPVAAAVIERFADKKPLTRRWLAGALLGVAGAALLSVAEQRPGDAGGASGTGMEPAVDSWAVPAGIVLGLVAGVTYALYSWAAHRLIGRGLSARATMGHHGHGFRNGRGAPDAGAPPDRTRTRRILDERRRWSLHGPCPDVCRVRPVRVGPGPDPREHRHRPLPG